MKLLHIVFYRGLFFFTMPVCVWAAVHSEVSLAYHSTANSAYNGCKVTFQVYEGTEEAKKRVWTGQLGFYGEGLPLVNTSILSRKQVDPEIKLRYVSNDARYKASFETVPPLRSMSPDGFTYEETACMEDSIIAGNMITWSLNNHAISVQDVVDTVNNLKDGGRFPKYKLYGYDWNDNVANCVTFSCRFLRAFGVNIDACTELTPWLKPTRGSGLSWAGYYIFAFGWTHDHVRLRNAVLSIAQYHNNVRWNRGDVQSGAPRFALKSIEDVLPGADISSVRAYIQ